MFGVVKKFFCRRKCIGRNQKQMGDYLLLTGCSTLALETYQTAIEYLEQASDFLWLAGFNLIFFK